MYNASPTIKPIGALLVGAGALLLLAQTVGFNVFTGGIYWPLFILAPGLAVLALASLSKTLSRGLSPLGMAVTLTGSLLAYQAWADHFQSWAYGWILVGPFALGAGLAFHGFVHGDARALRNGRGVAGVSLVVFAGAAVMFELVFNISGYGASFDLPWGIVLPVALIAIGGAFLLRAPHEH